MCALRPAACAHAQGGKKGDLADLIAAEDEIKAAAAAPPKRLGASAVAGQVCSSPWLFLTNLFSHQSVLEACCSSFTQLLMYL